MRIVYCEGCSRRLCTESLEGMLKPSAEEPAYCQNCCPKPVEPILNMDLVNKTINEARKKTASGIQKAASRNHKSGIHKAASSGSHKALRLRRIRRWKAAKRNVTLLGAMALMIFSAMW
jgi:hypothetical protein